jgi:WD40 repeat protein
VNSFFDRTVKIWDTGSGECLQTHKGHSDWVSSVAFSHNSAWLASASYDSTVKIWDTGNSECLQTLSIGEALEDIAFSTTDSYLLTNRGTLDLTLSAATCYASYQGGGLSVDSRWITHNSKNAVWLPAEYRPSCSAMSRTNISTGVGSGKIWICCFSS